MKPLDCLDRLPENKRRFALALFESIGSTQGVLSTTLVGSFCSQPGIEGISDIDTIVIVDRITQSLFSEIHKSVKSAAKPELLGLPKHQLVINDTFGPLKIDTPETVVLHLMIYDVEGHRKHVLESPFTCFDWEKSLTFHGTSLRDIYPVLRLQPSHFSEARRGMKDYIDDIRRGSISYREYQFLDDGKLVERKLEHPLDDRHKGEYAYHIIRNLLLNYAKLILMENTTLNTSDLCEFWKRHLPEIADQTNVFHSIASTKAQRKTIFPEGAIKLAEEVIQAFSNKFSQKWQSSAISIYLVRHGITSLNDGSFLGQRRNPSLISAPDPISLECVACFSSPLARAKETASAFFPETAIVEDKRLAEIDYGDAEGMRINELNTTFPEMTAAWAAKRDPNFPNGESTEDVLKRIRKFLDSLQDNDGPIWAFTHNIVIRTAIGFHLGIPASEWFRIPVDHLDPIEFRRYEGRYYLNLSKEQRAKITDQLVNHDLIQ